MPHLRRKRETHIHNFLPASGVLDTCRRFCLGEIRKGPRLEPVVLDGARHLLSSVVDLRGLEARDEAVQICELFIRGPPSSPGGLFTLGFASFFDSTFLRHSVGKTR